MSNGHSLVLRDVRKQFGKTEIIRGVNLEVAAGECVAIIGPNGAGKSTLFKLIADLVARGFKPERAEEIAHNIKHNKITKEEAIKLGASKSTYYGIKSGRIWKQA